MKVIHILEAKTTKAEAPKPRNFVAKNAINTGAGAHKDKKKAAKQGDVKHKSKAMAEAQDVSIGDLSGMNKRLPGVDKNGRTQSQWLKLVKQKFPDAKVMQAKMPDGPCHAVLPDGRRASWIKVEKQDSPSFVNPWDKAKQGVGEQNVAEGSAHGYNVTRFYRKYRDQSKITRWLKKEAGLPKETKLYFDDADLVLGSDTIVPYALVDENLKFNDLLTALVKATGGTAKQKVDGVYRDQGMGESATAGATSAANVSVGPVYKNKPAKTAKNKDGTAKNAVDIKGANLITGGSLVKR